MSAPRDPEAAFLLATFFLNTGGALVIDSNGARHIVVDLEATGDRCRLQAMFETMIKRLHHDDLEFVFDAFGDCGVDLDNITGVDEPMRRAA